MTELASLLLIRIGSFSGSALTLRDALSRRVSVYDFDLLPRLRGWKGAPTRLVALIERMRERSRGSPMKTAAWSRAAQHVTIRSVPRDHFRAALFVQTIPAFVLQRDIRYGVYTDRVGKEGAAAGGPFASQFTQDWLKREAAFLRGAHRVYVMGSTTHDWLIGEYGVHPERIRVVGAGPNAAPGLPNTSERCRRLLFVGTQWTLKGGPELLAAFEQVRGEAPGIELLLAGSSPDFRLPPGVRALGRVPNSHMDQVYSTADAVVIPTHMEAFGISLIEALGRGIPCIATTVGNQRSIIGDGGICVPPGDVRALRDALKQLIGNFVVYRDAARRQGEELARRMSWDRVARVISQDLLPAESAARWGSLGTMSDG